MIFRKESYEISTKSNENSIFNKRYRYQLLGTITVHSLTLAQGISLGWLSPVLLLLQSAGSPLDFKVTLSDASWIGSLFGLGSLAGNIIIGLTITHFSRKFLMNLVAIPTVISWILIYFATDVKFIYLARFFNGITSGSHYITMGIFLSEIANPGIRGALSAFAVLTAYVGIFLGYFIPSVFSYHVTPWIVIVLPMIYIVSITRFPETPQYLLRHKRYAEAEASYRFYNNIKNSTNDDEPEAQAVLTDFEDLKMTIIKESENYTKVTINDFLNKPAMFAFLTAFVLISLNQFSGSYGVAAYMVDIFEKMGSPLDSKITTNIMGIVQIVGSICYVGLIDRLGRRKLIFTSATGLAICLLAKGLYANFLPITERYNYGWVPFILVGVNVFFTSLGVAPAVMVMVVEIMPVKIRSIGTSICMGLLSCAIFISLKLYLIALNVLGVSLTMYITCAITLLCTIYLAFFLKEMKGKSIDVDEQT